MRQAIARRSRQWAFRIIPVAVVALSLTVGGYASRDRAQRIPADPPAWMVVAAADGSVTRFSTLGGPRDVLVDDASSGLFGVASTQIAVDDRRQLLWYSDTHAAVRSIRMDTLEAGPTLSGFADVALVGCSTISDGRPVAVDARRRRLFAPSSTGGILVFDADSLTLIGAIGAGALETEPGMLPAVAVDEESGALWYASADGSAVELVASEATWRPSGRRVHVGTSMHDVRSLTVGGNELVALRSDGVPSAFELETLAPSEGPTLPTAPATTGIAFSR